MKEKREEERNRGQATYTLYGARYSSTSASFSDCCSVRAISEAVPAQKCTSVFLIPCVKSEIQDDAPTNVHIMSIQGSFQHDLWAIIHVGKATQSYFCCARPPQMFSWMVYFCLTDLQMEPLVFLKWSSPCWTSLSCVSRWQHFSLSLPCVEWG